MRFWTALRWDVFWRAALLYLLITAVSFHTVATGDAGFSYALDLPYVQMALAQHIAHGTYGINATEISSPVAGIAWPFLLALFSEASFFRWVPLVLNVAAGLCVCGLAAFWVDRYFCRSWLRLSWILRCLLALLFVLAANLPALTLVGMEHTLQVLVAGGCAAAIAETYFGRKIPAFSLVCAVLAPAVRYEGLAFTLAVCLACWSVGRRKAALSIAAVAALPLLLFGGYLHVHGLRSLPLSAVTEGRLLPASVLEQPSWPKLFTAIIQVNAAGYVEDSQRWPIAAFFVLLCVQAWRVRKERLKRNVLLGALAGLGLLLLLGPYGYFYRLDVPYRFFGFLLVFAVASEYERFTIWPAVATGFTAAAVYCLATMQVSAVAWETAHGQKQARRFIRSFYGGNVLITDPGWAAFDSQDRFYVASAESFTGEHEAELQRALRGHNVRLAMLSPRVRMELPSGWKPIANLCRYGEGFRCAAIWLSPEINEDGVRDALQKFAATLSPGTWLTYQDGVRKDVP